MHILTQRYTIRNKYTFVQSYIHLLSCRYTQRHIYIYNHLIRKNYKNTLKHIDSNKEVKKEGRSKIDLYTLTHPYKHANTHTYIQIYAHINIHTHRHTYIDIYSQPHMYENIE